MARSPELRALDGSGDAGLGAPLEPATNARLGSLLGHDFSGVRVHTDTLAERVAEALSARAVTVGRDVYFNRGQYAPGTREGDRLLAHELTHVAQHDQGRLPQPAAQGLVVTTPVAPTEREAHAAEARVDSGLPSGVPPASVPVAAPATSGRVAGPRLIQRQLSPFVDPYLRLYGPMWDEETRDEVVELKGKPRFEPSPRLTELLRLVSQFTSRHAPVHVRFGNLARGRLWVRMEPNGEFNTRDTSAINLEHPSRRRRSSVRTRSTCARYREG